jgi:hypothetical protein
MWSRKWVVHELPLNGRNFTQLLVLTPGVNPVSVSQGPQSTMSFQSEGNTGIPNSTIANASIQGQQNRSKIYYFDGIINTSVRGTSYVVLPDIDMIQEFRVQSHNDKAEFGGVTGGVVNMYSKSGTNDFHGSAFWYVRNDFFDARDPFRDATREDPTAFRQNQFGANIGGPIIRNKTFFHGGYDGGIVMWPAASAAFPPAGNWTEIFRSRTTAAASSIRSARVRRRTANWSGTRSSTT